MDLGGYSGCSGHSGDVEEHFGQWVSVQVVEPLEEEEPDAPLVEEGPGVKQMLRSAVVIW